jgi:NitT/TauT family transport system substrate-binding protein
LVAGGVTAGATLTGCMGILESNDGETTEELTELTYRHRYKRTGIGTGLNDAGVELGTWEEEGLDVSFETSSGSKAAAPSVASGKDMFGNAGLSTVLGLNEEGADLVVIGQLLDPMGGVVTTGEQGITTWSDLEGKTVGQYPFGSTGPEAKAAMRKKGVDLSTIEFQNVQPGNGERLLRNGDIDAMIKFVPLSKARLVKAGYSPNVLVSSNAIDYLGISLYTRREVIENRPETVDSFVRGWLKAYQIFANRIDEVFEIYKPLAAEGFDEEIQREALAEYYAAQVPDPSIGTEYGKGWTSPEKMEKSIETFSDAGLIEGDVDAEEMYTNQFIDDNQELAVETAQTIYDRLKDFEIGPNYI